MNVSYAQTAEQFRDEIVRDLRAEAAKEKTVEDFGKTQREAVLARACRFTLERYADFLAETVFVEKPKEAPIDFRPAGGLQAVSRSIRELTSRPVGKSPVLGMPYGAQTEQPDDLYAPTHWWP